MMRVVLVPSSVTKTGLGPHQYLTSYVINDAVAIDAGSLGSFLSPTEQGRVKDVFITHSHIDHIAGLPVFIENVYEGKPDCVTVHATREVLDTLQKDIFNDRVWPDFVWLSSAKAPFLRLSELVPNQPVEVAGLRITPVPVNHVVPTCGFIVEDDATTLVFPSDTGPTSAIWEQANAAANLKAVFLEATFPNSMTWLADVAKHHTPATFGREVAKLTRPTKVVAVHIKPRYRDEVVRELEALKLPDFVIAEAGRTYEF
jgi:ribonuclease BN (tRNA processing enzyme)